MSLDPKVDQLKIADDASDNDTEFEDAVESHEAGAGAAEKKKKKKKKSNKKKKKTQTEPPSVGLSKIFTTQKYPEDELMPYTNLKRTTDEEKRALEREEKFDFDFLNDLRKGAEIHREVRHYAQKTIKPGMSLIEIAEMIESSVQSLAEGKDWIDAGTGFPTGLSINDCAAHYTPNRGDTTTLKASDVLKVDFGVQVHGRIIDSAFTWTQDPRYDPLLDAVRSATNTGIKESGIDVRLCDVGAAVQEVMESYEVELDGRTYPVRCIKNLNGHNIHPYTIHGGKSLPIIDNGDQTKMEEGELFACETFGSTGRGLVLGQGECSHYARIADAHGTLRLQSAKQLLSKIDKTFGTLPWCRRYLDKFVDDFRYMPALNSLVKAGIVQDYPPLMDTRGCYTAQYEHTFVLRPTTKEILSRGDDY